jgi:hypothetical protein
MITVLSVLVALTGIVVSVWSTELGWGLLLFAEAWVLARLFVARQTRWARVPQLSERANQVLQEYGYFYAEPLAARDYNSASRGLLWASCVLGAIAACKNEWWVIAAALANVAVMHYAALAFDPTRRIGGSVETAAHEEVVGFLMERQRGAPADQRQTATASARPLASRR